MKLSNFIEQSAETTAFEQAIQAHHRRACGHKIALHVDAAIDVVDTDPAEADAWAYEAGKEAWEFDIHTPEKLASHPALSAAFKRGFDSVEQQSRSQRDVKKYAIGDWYHLFGPGSDETRCRIAIDLEQSKLVAAQEWTGLKFVDVLGDRLKDLAESVIEVNEAHAKVEEWAPDPEFSNELPEWVSPRNLTSNPEIISKGRCQTVTDAEIAELRAAKVSWYAYCQKRLTANHANALSAMLKQVKK